MRNGFHLYSLVLSQAYMVCVTLGYSEYAASFASIIDRYNYTHAILSGYDMFVQTFDIK